MTFPIITLLTDFGARDAYVGVMKGVILSVAPDARVVDLCHETPPHDIAVAAFLLAGAYHYFPRGTVHLVVVDPGVGTERRPVALAAGGHYFVGPDNGIFTLVLQRAGLGVHAVHLTEASYWLPSPSATFHGRDIFAPVAARLAGGQSLNAFGQALDPAHLVRLGDVLARQAHGYIEGAVVHIDHFGNLLTNIPEAWLAEGGPWRVSVAGRQLHGLRRAYGDVAPGETLALIGSGGFLEIAVSQGSAAASLGASRGLPVHVHRISVP